MRKLRIVLNENKTNKKILKEFTGPFRNREFAVHVRLVNWLEANHRDIYDSILNDTEYNSGAPSTEDVRQFQRFANLLNNLNQNQWVKKFAGESEGEPFFALVRRANNDTSRFFTYISSEPVSLMEADSSAPTTSTSTSGGGGEPSAEGTRRIANTLGSLYRATILPFLLNHVDYSSQIKTIQTNYTATLANANNHIEELSNKIKGRTETGLWASVKGAVMDANETQAKRIVSEIVTTTANYIERCINLKESADKYSQGFYQGRLAVNGEPATTTPSTTPSAAPTTTTPEGPETEGEPSPPETTDIGSKNPVPLFNKGNTSDSLLSSMLMAMNQRVQNNSTDGKGLILSTTDGKKIRLIDAFKNYDKLTPDSKKFVDQIQFIMKDLAGQLKVNGIRINEATAVDRIAGRTGGSSFKTSAPDERDRDPKKRTSGEAGGGLEMVKPIAGFIDVRRAVYRKILRALKVLIDTTSTPTAPVFRGDIDKVAISIADGAVKVAMKFLVTNLSQRGVNVTDKRSKKTVPAKNVGKNYGKKGDPDAGKEKNITLLEDKSSKLLKEYREHIEAKLVPYMQKQIGFNKPPIINFLDDAQNAANPMGKTAFYDPQSMEISVYTTGRHPKDIMRSVAHEVIHHAQNCRGDLDPQRMGEASEGYAQKNPYLRKLEEEAYLLGNMTFRDWEDGMKTNQLNENHDCNKVHPGKTHAAYKRDDKEKTEEKSLEEWKNEERWDLLMKRFKIVSEKRFANDPKLDKDGDGKPKWADEDDDNPEDSKKQAKGKK